MEKERAGVDCGDGAHEASRGGLSGRPSCKDLMGEGEPLRCLGAEDSRAGNGKGGRQEAVCCVWGTAGRPVWLEWTEPGDSGRR